MRENKIYEVKDFAENFDEYFASEDNVDRLLVADYIPSFEKIKYCNYIIDKTCYENKRFVMNSAFRSILYPMILIDIYTSIEVNFDNIYEEYDCLEMYGLLDYLMTNVIPNAEILRFDEILQCLLNDLYENNRSAAALQKGRNQ